MTGGAEIDPDNGFFIVKDLSCAAGTGGDLVARRKHLSAPHQGIDSAEQNIRGLLSGFELSADPALPQTGHGCDLSPGGQGREFRGPLRRRRELFRNFHTETGQGTPFP